MKSELVHQLYASLHIWLFFEEIEELDALVIFREELLAGALAPREIVSASTRECSENAAMVEVGFEVRAVAHLGDRNRWVPEVVRVFVGDDGPLPVAVVERHAE